MLAFFTKFGRMKAVYDAATQAAAQYAAGSDASNVS
jgi:hypothetical protein